jgi:hypothetical protein
MIKHMFVLYRLGRVPGEIGRDLGLGFSVTEVHRDATLLVIEYSH